MKKNLALICFLLTTTFSHGFASEKKSWMTLEDQFDTRKFNTLNVTGFSTLPGGFSVWGFTDLEGEKNLNNRKYDFVTHFTELDLRSPTWQDVGLIAELNSASGANNDLGRFGLFYLPKWDLLKKNKLFLFFKAFPIETDGEGGQLSFSWNVVVPRLFEDRVSLGGFFDLNLKSGKDSASHIVSDTQFRVRLIGDLSFLLEYRVNDFLAQRKSGLGIGFQYRF